MINRKNSVPVIVPSNAAVRNGLLFPSIGLCIIGCFFLAIAIVIVLSLIPLYISAKQTDISTRNGAGNNTSDSFFVFDFLNANSGVSVGGGGRVVSATGTNFPALISNGMAMTVGYLSACGINLPHTHPRATELNFVVSGQFESGFFQENTARFIMQTVNTGQAMVFPQGSIHFEQNLNCEPAVFVAGFNSADPGVQTIASALFGGLPADITGASLGGLNISSIDDLKRLLPNNPALGIELCRKRCGLK